MILIIVLALIFSLLPVFIQDILIDIMFWFIFNIIFRPTTIGILVLGIAFLISKYG
ncbi:hypothetical protein JP0092_01670 [Helicobacter pylori]|nr:hypothetical protein JP0092_01670 [Helicobacter pylori]